MTPASAPWEVLRHETPALAEPIRLLKFVTVFAVGGTERQVVTLAERLDQSRYDLHIACLRRSGELLPRMERLGHGVVGYEIPNLYGRRALRERRRLARYLRRHRIEIVHTYNFYPNVFTIPVARLARVPVIIASIRDTGAYLTPIQQRVQRVICHFADCIVANAEAVRQWLTAQGYDGEKITVIRNGVDLAMFGRSRDGRRLRHELGLAPQTPVVAVVSRLSRIKGLEYFVDAATAVATTCPDVRFLIVGEGSFRERDYQQELEGYAKRLSIGDRLIFTGLRHDVPDVLSEVAVSVLPSLSEGLSNTLLESMAAGVPVVATRVGGNPEAVDEGVTGLLVPPRDAGALARAIRRLLEDRGLAARLGRAARQRAMERFSIDSMIRETERLYRTLLEAKRRGQRNRPRADLIQGRGVS